MLDYNKMARRALRVWIRQVLDEKGWSAREWAMAAGTTPTNITRLLSTDDAPLPTAATLMRLATIARSQPNLVGGIKMVANDTPAERQATICPHCGKSCAAMIDEDIAALLAASIP